jgi:hypothetical protein
MAFDVRGYYHPTSAFHTILEWEAISNEFLELDKQGYDTRGGKIDNNPKLVSLVNKYFSFQLYVETQRYDQLTQVNVLNFIEDFTNHRVWSMRDEFRDRLPNGLIDEVKVAFFYSRGDLEPFMLMDNSFTNKLYGTTDHIVTTLHWTSLQGAKNLADSIESGHEYAISTFTKQYKEFFRPESNILVKLKGKLVCAFKSDAKTIVTDSGMKAANMFRLGYPGESDNICSSTDACSDSDHSTYLWNEIIVVPVEILDVKKILKY